MGLAATILVLTSARSYFVTLPGTSYVVTYSGRKDEGAPMTHAEFHARAWKAERHKARALGLIV